MSRAYSFHEIISSCSRDILRSKENDSGIDLVLHKLLEATGVDRVYVFREHKNVDGTSLVSYINEACAEGIEPQLNNPDLSEFPWKELTPTAYQAFLEKKSFSGHVVDMSLDMQTILEPQGIQSVLLVPIESQDHLMGFIGFDSVLTLREWTQMESDLLLGVSSVLGAIWTSISREKLIQKSFDKINRYHALSPFAVMEWSVDFKLLYANSTAERMFGYQEHEWIGQNGNLVISPVNTPSSMGLWNTMSSEEQMNPVIHENIRKDGSSIICRWHYSVLRKPDGEIESVLTIAEDATDELRLQSDFGSLFEQGSDGVIFYDTKGNVDNVNPAACRLINTTAEQVIGLNSADLPWITVNSDGSVLPADERPAMVALRTGTQVRDVLMGIKNTSGDRITWVLINAIPMFRGNDEKPYRVFSTIRDITERQIMAQDMSEREERFRLFAENLSDAIWMRKKGTGEVVFQNRAIKEILGISSNEFLSDPDSIMDFIPLEDRASAWTTHRQYLNGSSFEKEHQIIRPNGDIRWVFAKGFEIPSQIGEPLLAGVMSDITERKRINVEIELTKRRAEELSRLKSNIIQNIRHELRTPITGVSGFLDLAKDRLTSDPQGLEYLSYVERSITRLSNTLETIVDYSIIDSRIIESRPKHISLKETLGPILNNFRADAKEKDLYFQTFWEGRDDVVIDPLIVLTILRHTVDNSVKFTEVGGVKVTIDTKETELALIVRDSGLGIEEDQLNYIFDDFRQGSEGVSRTFDGSGLGLSIVKKYVDFLKGTVDVKSTVDDLTTFTIRLPIAPNERIAVDMPNPVHRILFVEDDSMIQLVMKKSLPDYVVDTASSVDEAKDLISKHTYDAFLLDINLGRGMSGIDLCDIIRNELKLTNVPIAAVTATGIDPNSSLLSRGFTHYLPKPFDRDQIHQLIQSMGNYNPSTLLT